METLTQEQRQHTLQRLLIVFGHLVQAQNRALEAMVAYANKLDEHPGNYIGALEKGILRNIDAALDMMPTTESVIEQGVAQLIEILDHPFNPGDQLAQLIEHEYNGKRIPIHSMS
jgi:hypothetical protein